MIFLLLVTGFIKFLGPYYMIIITKRKKIGMICGHAVYSIAKSEMIPIPHSSANSNMAYSKNENRSFANSHVKSRFVMRGQNYKIKYAFYDSVASYLLFTVNIVVLKLFNAFPFHIIAVFASSIFPMLL